MKVTVNNLEKEETIDWNKVQLVVSKYGEIVLTTIDKQSDCHFEGTVIFVENTLFNIGYHSEKWVKSKFKPFHGSITLQND
jgi:hypothetical protein